MFEKSGTMGVLPPAWRATLADRLAIVALCVGIALLAAGVALGCVVYFI